MKQKCKNCKHYSPFIANESDGVCVFPIPFWVSGNSSWPVIEGSEGENCKTYEPKETAEVE